MTLLRKLLHKKTIECSVARVKMRRVPSLSKVSTQQMEQRLCMELANSGKYRYQNRLTWGNKFLQGLYHRSFLCRVFLCGAPVLVYDWKNNNISDSKIEWCLKELDEISFLCESTIYCPQCKKRQIFDKICTGIDYCQCTAKPDAAESQDESWQPFLERDNIIVWRKHHEKFSNMFCYKVYGKYDDISASAFGEAQLNPDFRTVWDTTALELKVLDSCKQTKSDLLYWVVKFPRFFSNRDYVFKRRYQLFEGMKRLVIYSEATQHPMLPEAKDNHRVNDYWAIMVIEANTDFNEPGMSYTLTYFDNPGTTLPQAVTNFVATKSFPDFLARVSTAARNLQTRWTEGEDVYVTLPERLRFPPPAVSQIHPVEPPEESLDRTLRYKNIDLDILEAAEITAPDLTSKSLLTKKIERLAEVVRDLLQKPDSPIANLENLQGAVTSILKKGAKKRQQSLAQMREFEKKRHYHHDKYDESTQILLTKLFISIHEVLEADKAMRTGRGFVETSKKYHLPDDTTNFSMHTLQSSMYMLQYNTIEWAIFYFTMLLNQFSYSNLWQWYQIRPIVKHIHFQDHHKNKDAHIEWEGPQFDTAVSHSEPWCLAFVKACCSTILMFLKFLESGKV